MKRTVINSRIEVWCRDYINNPDQRNEERDKCAIIVQIEHACGLDYIVEVVYK